MSQSFEEYEQEFQALLSRVRSNLASNRSRSSLLECERLLQEARKVAVAMVGVAEMEGSHAKIRQAQLKLEREVRPLDQEVSAGLANYGDVAYQAPDLEAAASIPPAFSTETPQTSMDTQRLIAYSDDLLRESQALCDSSEQIGLNTLHRMSSQREQLESANRSLDRTTEMTNQARQMLLDMRNKGLRSKLNLYILIGLLLVANGYVIYWLFFKKKDTSDGGENY